MHTSRCAYRPLHGIVLLCALATAWITGCSTPQQVERGSGSAEFRPIESLETVEGVASYYGSRFHGRLTANGERYNKHLFSCAHRTYPFGTILRVTRIGTGKVVLVRVNDRGPYREGRVIDLSYAAAKELSMLRAGLVLVKIEVLSWGADTYAAGRRP